MVILTILFAVISIIAFSEEIEIPKLEIIRQNKTISQSISEDQNNVEVNIEAEIEFNLRLDPCGIYAYLNDSSENIEVTLQEGKKVCVKFNSSLKSGEKYALNILGVKEIYSGQKMNNLKIDFTTKEISVLEEKIDNTQKSYSVKLKNFSSVGKEIKQIIIAKNSEGNKILDVFVQSLYIEGGKEKYLPHTFDTLDGNVKIFGYTFLDIEGLQLIKN